MSESIQHRVERISAPERYLFTYNLDITATADRVVSDVALHSLGKAITAVGEAWLEALPRREK